MDERLAGGSDNGRVGPRTRSARVDVITRLAVVRTQQAQPELSIADLATTYGISESSVRRILAVQTADRKETVRAMLLSGAEGVVDHWLTAIEVAASKGYHQGARDFLVAADAIEAKPTVATAVSVAPAITLSMNFGLGALKDYKPEPDPVPPVIQATREAPRLPAAPTGKVNPQSWLRPDEC